MLFTLTDLETQISPTRLDKAWRLCADGCIPMPSILRGGELITNLIPSPGGRPLRVYVRIAKQQDNLHIHGECTCGMGENCEHVAGTLLQALDIRYDPQAAGPISASIALAPPLPPNQQAMLYILQFDGEDLLVETCIARRLKSGGYTTSGHYVPSRAAMRTPPRFLEPADLELLAALDRSPRLLEGGEIWLEGANSVSLLEAMLATGRCYFEQAESSKPLAQGEPRHLELQWICDEFGWQQGHWQITPHADHLLLPLSSPCYLDTRQGLCGSLESDLPKKLLHTLLTQPPISPEEVDTLYASWCKAHPGAKIPPLQRFETDILPKIKPVPCLRLTARQDEDFEIRDASGDLACLSFDYDGITIGRFTPDTGVRDGRLIQVQRDKKAEQAAAKLLRSLGLEEDEDCTGQTDEDCFFPPFDLDYSEADAWLNFQARDLPDLRARGWRIEYDRFSYRLAEASNWVCDVASLAQRDWFSIALGVEMDGRSIDLLPILLSYLGNFPNGLPKMAEIAEESFIVPVDNGQGGDDFLRLPAREFLPLLQTLLEIYDKAVLTADLRLPCNRMQLAHLTALQSADAFNLAWQAEDDEVRALVQRLSELDGIPAVAPPKGLTANLRAYQQTGLNWLQFLREYRLAGILADDMGLGKTVQALAHLLLEKEAGRADRPSLVIAPTSLMFNWRREAERFAPQLRVLVLHGADRKRSYAAIADQDLIITTYPLLTRDKELLVKQAYHLLILDEAQVIKNPKAQASRAAREIDARHRLCLTGTPLENHLGELWSLFDFLLPGLLGDSKQFRRLFRTPIEQRGDAAAAERLSRRIRPFLLRRTKQQVATELPEKTEIVQNVVLEGKQRELYETVRLSVHRRVREEIERHGLARSHIVVLDALLKLRQVCCDPRLVKIDKAHDIQQSAKLDSLMAMLEEMVEEGRRILIFSQFTAMLGLIEEAVKTARIDYVKLTGQTRDRETPVRRFQAGETPLFLISLKAGGVGLNLTAADTIIHYDPWWNPAAERQATDRAHRIGQKQAVFVYKLICEGTLEEKILAMQQRKQRLADGLYGDGGNQEPQWNEEDLEILLGPLHA